jgi:DNA-directed RNA polymerase alpha subunit
MAKVPKAPDTVWQTIRLAAPARRALVNAGITSFDDLAAWTQADVTQLHGMGPKALDTLIEAMGDAGVSFAR